MRKYELTVLMRIRESEEEQMADIQNLDREISKCGVTLSFEDAGSKTLSYEMLGEKKARYLYYTVNLTDGGYHNLTDKLNTELYPGDDSVLRYLIVIAREDS